MLFISPGFYSFRTQAIESHILITCPGPLGIFQPEIFYHFLIYKGMLKMYIELHLGERPEEPCEN